ncbi:MAG TPA: phage tail sheath C-terminal domain-containing protein [Candidatus Binataceae bacterium]|nr:phage tail sheath C-terminal domain-containing protein [Candidatus Binataceae bacterium]
MAVIKPPGVYIVEKDAFPNSVVEVATAVPAFIGYTEKADDKGKSLKNVPWRISSRAEFLTYFGGSPKATFNVKPIEQPAASAPAQPAARAPEKAFSLGDIDYVVTATQKSEERFLLYYSMLLFFQNGGGPCYIVSVGTYDEPITAKKLTDGITLLLKEQEPTMVVIPDAVRLDRAGCQDVQAAALMHCGKDTQSRVVILDIYNGFEDWHPNEEDCVTQFRNDIGTNYLDFGAAYFPWLRTSIVADTDPDFDYSLVNSTDLTALLTAEAVEVAQEPNGKPLRPNVIAEVKTLTEEYNAQLLHKTLVESSPVFSKLLSEIKRQLNLLPPSAAMAGIYSMVDGTSGVWKAPANVSLNSVIAPTVNISPEQQQDLNVDVQGKSINAIRLFSGEGVLVWGARTLDGNSVDWRYINVRRTMIMLEQSIKLAAKAYAFEPNVSTTWVTIKSMIRNFLIEIWNRGGLAGATPDDAFAVSCGLGETMTADDVVEGILRVTVLVAVTHPGEFIEITFQQQMQNS